MAEAKTDAVSEVHGQVTDAKMEFGNHKIPIDEFSTGWVIDRTTPQAGQVVGAIKTYLPSVTTFTRHLSKCKAWFDLCKTRESMGTPVDIMLNFIESLGGVNAARKIQLIKCHIISLTEHTVANPQTGEQRKEEVLTVQPSSRQ